MDGGEHRKAHPGICFRGRWVHEVDACVLGTCLVTAGRRAMTGEGASGGAGGADGGGRGCTQPTPPVATVTMAVTVALGGHKGDRRRAIGAWPTCAASPVDGRVTVKDTTRRPGLAGYHLPRTVGAAAGSRYHPRPTSRLPLPTPTR